MDRKDLHKLIDSNQEKNFFGDSKPVFKKSKSEAFSDIIEKIDSGKPLVTHSSVSTSTKIFYSLAAALLLFIATGYFLRHYSVSNYCGDNERKAVNLPNGSIVTLQPNSSFTYYPLWWNIKRKTVLSGEAYFDVTPGTTFEILSQLGTTEVLGTTFNIVANNNQYLVSCFTGSVKVTSITDQSVILNPDYTAEVVNGDIKVAKYDASRFNSTIYDNMFDFESIPLSRVLKEIEDFYNITITSSVDLRYNYTGFFSKQKSVEEALYILCKPYGLTFVVLSKNKYHIVKN